VVSPPTRSWEAAREAGAEQYAGVTLRAAVDALAGARQAVVDGDYRLALSGALDSRDQAYRAAQEATEVKARQRAAAERLLSEVTAQREEAERGMATPARTRVGRRRVADSHAVLTRASKALQEASALVEEGDYQAATLALSATKERLDALRLALDAPTPVQSSRRER
jgi:hypothetical protein